MNSSLDIQKEDSESFSIQMQESMSYDDHSENITVQNKEKIYGFKIVGDNVDKNVNPTYQRPEMQRQSFHHFHAYAVRDRVCIESLSDGSPEKCVPDPDKFIPDNDDISWIKKEMSTLLSR